MLLAPYRNLPFDALETNTERCGSNKMDIMKSIYLNVLIFFSGIALAAIIFSMNNVIVFEYYWEIFCTVLLVFMYLLCAKFEKGIVKLYTKSQMYADVSVSEQESYSKDLYQLSKFSMLLGAVVSLGMFCFRVFFRS